MHRDLKRCGCTKDRFQDWPRLCGISGTYPSGTLYDNRDRATKPNHGCNALVCKLHCCTCGELRRNGARSPLKQTGWPLEQCVTESAAAGIDGKNAILVIHHFVKSMADEFLCSQNHSSLRAIACAARPLTELS